MNDIAKAFKKDNTMPRKGFSRSEKKQAKKMLLEQQKQTPISQAFLGKPAISPRQDIRNNKYLCPCGKVIKIKGFETPDMLSAKCAEKCNTIIKIKGSQLAHFPTIGLRRLS